MIATLLLAGCEVDIGEDIDRDAPSITITSHTFGQSVSGSNITTLTGDVSADTTRVVVTLNDADVSGVSLSAASFSVDLTLANGANTIIVKVNDENNNSNSITFTLFYPFLTLSDGQAASYVIGQADPTMGNDPNQGNVSPAANTLSSVSGGLFERNNTELYIADTGNNRVLRFSSIPAVSNASASAVFGQPDFATATAGNAATELNGPKGVFASNAMMLIADTGNNRVLIWNSLPANGSVPADLVLGQTDFGLTAAGCADTALNGPSSVFLVNDTVIVVSDTGNNRILIWNTIPTSSGVAADLVLGQQSLSVCAADDSDGDGASDVTPDADALDNPGGIWTDGNRLLVADTNNSRVLVWNTFPTAIGQAADFVLGQDLMTTEVAAIGQNSLSFPLSVSSNGNQISVADTGNNRALIWNAFPAANKPNADSVIGQVDFGSSVTGTTDTLMTTYDNIFSDRARLFVVDGNRIMMFIP